MVTILHNTLPARFTKGFLTLTDRLTGKTLFEGDMRQCCHCQMVWKHQPGSKRQRGWCTRCAGHVCGKRTCVVNCYPAEQQIEDSEALYRRNKASIEAAWRHRQWLASI